MPPSVFSQRTRTQFQRVVYGQHAQNIPSFQPIITMKNLPFIFLCLLAASCSSMLGVPQYSFVFVNATTQELNHVDCTALAGFHAHAGYLGPGNHKSDSLIPDPMPDEVTVTWQTVDGQNHSQRVTIKNRLPSHFSGEVILTFTPDGSIVVSNKPY